MTTTNGSGRWGRTSTIDNRGGCAVVCRSGAGRRQADGSRSDVVVSGVVDSGRESGHGNIDANDPKLPSRLRGEARGAWAAHRAYLTPRYTLSELPPAPGERAGHFSS